jgi:CysZ protein
MIAGLLKAFAQLPEPALRRVLLRGILGALAVYVALVATVWIVVARVSLFTEAWADLGTGIVLVLTALVVPLLFFPALATAIMSPMLDSAADAVEARHYPHLAPPRHQKWTEVMAGTLRFLAVMVAINLVALPVYAVLLITGFTFVLVTIVNGYLLGREYFELVALRRLEAPAVRLMFRNNLGRLWLAGAMVSFLFSIPVLNLAAPVVGAAFMVHVVQGLTRPGPG